MLFLFVFLLSLLIFPFSTSTDSGSGWHTHFCPPNTTVSVSLSSDPSDSSDSDSDDFPGCLVLQPTRPGPPTPLTLSSTEYLAAYCAEMCIVTRDDAETPASPTSFYGMLYSTSTGSNLDRVRGSGSQSQSFDGLFHPVHNVPNWENFDIILAGGVIEFSTETEIIDAGGSPSASLVPGSGGGQIIWFDGVNSENDGVVSEALSRVGVVDECRVTPEDPMRIIVLMKNTTNNSNGSRLTCLPPSAFPSLQKVPGVICYVDVSTNALIAVASSSGYFSGVVILCIGVGIVLWFGIIVAIPVDLQQIFCCCYLYLCCCCRSKKGEIDSDKRGTNDHGHSIRERMCWISAWNGLMWVGIVLSLYGLSVGLFLLLSTYVATGGLQLFKSTSDLVLERNVAGLVLSIISGIGFSYCCIVGCFVEWIRLCWGCECEKVVSDDAFRDCFARCCRREREKRTRKDRRPCLGAGCPCLSPFYLLYVIFCDVDCGLCAKRGFCKTRKEQNMIDSDHSKHRARNPCSSLRSLESGKLTSVKWSDLQLGTVLGRGGSHSTVMRAEWMDFDVAVKVFDCEVFDDDLPVEETDTFAEFEQEANLMSRLIHPAILRLFGISIDTRRIGLVMELCINGDWKRFLVRYRRENQASLSLKKKIGQLDAVAGGMRFLHSQNVIHRDLKLENVLIDDNEAPKIMDFGLSRHVESMSVSKTKGVGTCLYMAPEIVRGEDYDEKIDSYAFGIMMFMVLTENYRPFGKQEFVQFRTSNDPDYRPDVSNVPCSARLRALIQACWSHDPSHRPSFGSIAEVLKTDTGTSSRAGTVVYLRSDVEMDEDAEDVVLGERTYGALVDVIRNKYGSVRIGPIVAIGEDEMSSPLRTDDDVKRFVDAEVMVVVELAKMDGE